MTERVISVANDFSRYPAGRYKSDGPFSGQHFRDDFVVPALRENELVVVDLDGTRGYGSSFLEEAFGGLVRLGFSTSDLRERLSFRSTDPSLEAEIKDYIEQAAAAQ